MKRREFLVRLGQLSLLSLPVGFAGCVGSGSDTGYNSESGATTSGDSGSVQESSGTGTSGTSSLAGTCPKGKSCMHPECEMWSDQNSNGMCDRGYREA